MKKSTKNTALSLCFGAAISLGSCEFAESKNNKPISEVLPPITATGKEQPNILLILADDMGWGDLGCYGSQLLDTPNIDSLAADGMRFTNFYSSNALCTPSRTGLLTGRYPQRVGMHWVLWAEDLPLGEKALRKVAPILNNVGGADIGEDSEVRGLPEDEITIAEALKHAGYNTGHVGKWHQGDFRTLTEYNPLNHGFDFFHGLPWDQEEDPCPLYVDYDVVKEEWEDLADIHQNLADAASDYITEAAAENEPFFLYYAPPDPHIPLLPSQEFKGKSEGGIYGDVVEEMDANIGQVLAALEKTGEADNTIVIFTSDNGPWYHGSTGGQRGKKGQSYEGGFSVPAIFRWPGIIEPGSVCNEPAVNLDLMPTLVSLVGGTMPNDRIVDGQDITPLLVGENWVHDPIYFYHHADLEGVRWKNWKYYDDISTYVYPVPVDKDFMSTFDEPWLYNLEKDPTESYPLSEKHPQVAQQMQTYLDDFNRSMEDNPKGWIP